jgi:adenosylcobinamide kinase/adenosylcobinamide-phosphate guanylyltransferase
MRRVTLVLGGARSGKSRFAEALARGHKRPLFYIATAEITDAEMRDRIDEHRRRRGMEWTTIEAPLDLVGALDEMGDRRCFILVDCITVWLNNLMHHGRDVAREVERLCACLATIRARLVIVSNEVGLGIVPDNALARAFRDEAGRVNQALAEAVDEVVFIAAGLPTTLKKVRPARPKARSRARGPGRKGRGRA